MRHPEVLARLTRRRTRRRTSYARRGRPRRPCACAPCCPLVVRKLTEPLELGGLRAPGGVDRRAVHLPRAPAPRRVPRPARVPPRALPRAPAPGTYTWIPFGGGVRRCLGASFALFEMKVVLQALVARLHLSAAEPRAERVTRRAITLSPSRAARLVVARVRPAPHARRSARPPPRPPYDPAAHAQGEAGGHARAPAALRGARCSRGAASSGVDRRGRGGRRASPRARSTRTSRARRSCSWRCSTSASPSGVAAIDSAPRRRTRSPRTQARAGGGDFARYLTADPEWQRLFFEFAAHAGRDERFREELVPAIAACAR